MYDSARTVEEGINTVFFIVWNDRNKYDRQRGTVKSWITGVARIVALSMRRQIQRRSRLDLVDLEVLSNYLTSESDPVDDVLAIIAIEEASDLLEKAMAQLTPKQRQLVRYRFMNNLSYREIAEEVGATLPKDTRVHLEEEESTGLLNQDFDSYE